MEELRERGFGVAAISYDSEAVLADFSQRRGITFPLLSDDDSEGITEFGILNTVAYEATGPNATIRMSSPTWSSTSPFSEPPR